jgi:hypothetical protein
MTGWSLRSRISGAENLLAFAFRLVGEKDSEPEQFRAGASVHLAFEHF